MDLPGPPGAEGYHDVAVTEVPRKLDTGEICTKAEQEFQEHLKSLKIKLEDDSTRCMVEKRGRDVSGKWIYLCYPCAAVCSGEAILQTHISGKKHKNKLSAKSVWPMDIFREHPYIVNERGGGAKVDGKSGSSTATETVLKKMAQEVDLYNKDPNDLDTVFSHYRVERCHIQDSLDNLKAPLVGVEYLIEHPPEEAHHEPCYMCTLCSKQGHPRTIVNHMTCFWHRYNYLIRHFPQACSKLQEFRGQAKYREGVNVIMNRLAQRIEDKFGRMKPVHIDKFEYEKNAEKIQQWLVKQRHFCEGDGYTFEEVVDVDLITSLHRSDVESQAKLAAKHNKDPSPPVVAAPIARFNSFTRVAGRQQRRGGSPGVDDHHRIPLPDNNNETDNNRGRGRRVESSSRARYEPYPDRHRESPPISRLRFTNKKASEKDPKEKPRNYDYKVKLADERSKQAMESANKTLAYHEKNPEKHPMYPEEWKNFWNRRYKELQAEGKDPSKHDFKPEWIVFWSSRMKELHERELRTNIIEIYRKLCMSPPPADGNRKTSPRPRPKSQERISNSQERRRSPERRPERRRSPEYERRRRSPPPSRRPEPRRRSPEHRRVHRSPPPRRYSPPPRSMERSRSPMLRARSPPRTKIVLDSIRRSRSRSRSPLSRREHQLRNNSPQHQPPLSLQTVMISDDELKPDDNLSPWNSDNDIDSIESLPDARSPPQRSRSRTNSVVSHASRSMRHNYPTVRGADPQDLGPPENVVATLRLLVALEDYLGSIGPKVVDLMTEAITMEKEEANSSEELLERESALVLIETAKEKLKGAAQAGLVAAAAANAVRTAVVRAAATLHAADLRAKRKQQTGVKSSNTSSSRASQRDAGMPVAGVGEVDRAQIAQQMAAALIAQGKTDVSSEELAQLVDAVVGMAEAKKREAEVKKKVEARAMAEKQARPAVAPGVSGTASALQMLQSAYDENDKKAPEKEDVPDAMDGLSDSDLETLLKNFNELSAEEQHSLIAYLKKLEAKEPKRVEKLRQYVSTASTSAPKPKPAPEPSPTPLKEDKPATPDKSEAVKPVLIESDDDDYTVEEVFQSATKKVKEDQIRQEMEIVKKSLEETKATPPLDSPTPTVTPAMNMSSATDLFALVQASIQATSAATQPAADIITINTQLRSFGDAPEPAPTYDVPSPDFDNQYDGPIQNNQPVNNMPQPNMFSQGGFRPAPNQMTNNMGNDTNISPWEDNRGPQMGMNNMGRPMGGPSPQGNFGPAPFSQGNFMNGNMQNNFRPRANNPGMQGNIGGNSFGGPKGNFGGNQGPGFGGNQGGFGGNQGNFGGSQGGFGDNQGFGGNQGNFGGGQGGFSDNQGGFGGNQGNFGGSQGGFGDNQGGFGGNQGNFGGAQGGFDGNRGNFGGNQGGPRGNRGRGRGARGQNRGRGRY